MKYCVNCGHQVDDDAVFCPNCGKSFDGTVNTYADTTDHTAEFDAKDISDNKVFAMLVYLTGIIGIIVSLLAAGNSPYAAFHVRQGLKISVVSILIGLIAAILCWTIIVPIAAGILTVVLEVVKIICFFRVCAGKAKEPPIISGLAFLK